MMGGGLGLFAGCRHGVVTEKTMMAMPEITIGLYPDVGGSWFLNRMPGQLGLFLALTGARINAQDCLYSGLAMLDAPVSGGVAAAEAGTLSFMCGGEQDTFAKIKPLLEAMGKNIFHAGGAGAGQSAKVCNNMLLSILMLGTSEAIKLGIDHGLDPAVLSEIMLASSGRNWTLECYNPCPGVMATAPSSHDYQPGFMVDLMYKDLGLAMDAAQGSKSPVPMGALAHSIYSAHSANGNGRKDFSSVFADLARLAD